MKRFRAYGVRPEQMLRACEICGSTENLVADHDHSTGLFRGTLCEDCNFGLGRFKDQPELLSRARLYLEATG